MRIVISGVGAIWPDPVPEEDPETGRAFVARGFDAVALLGRRATQYSHRSAQLVMAACGLALDDAGLTVTDENRDRVGLTVGTAAGSVTGVAEFGLDSFVQPRPHMVTAAKSPNCVLNAAAGSTAIRYGLRGVNATVAAGPASALVALRHAMVMLRAGHADTVVAGASEEFTGPVARVAQAARAPRAHGEGAAMFVLEDAAVAQASGRTGLAEVAALTVRAVPGPRAERLVGMVAAALETAGVAADEVVAVAARRTGESEADAAQDEAIATALPAARRLYSEERIGDCYGAHAALQIATLLAERTLPAAVVAVDPDGLLSVAVLKSSRP
ncbi:beta-ketoacyl synthase N-terminal-like domain-containing protein [Streptomyces sp. NPDC058739]|uniref:beta-ketoacyl synthase N-terminal-like domain-containing protein n=1 Tax=Streptomyces sp. NPDC058739 TaxID=3346618 RepID=UPI0036AFEAE2